MIASRLWELDQQLTIAPWKSDAVPRQYNEPDWRRDERRIGTLRNALPALANVVEAAEKLANSQLADSTDDDVLCAVCEESLLWDPDTHADDCPKIAALAALAELAEALA